MPDNIVTVIAKYYGDIKWIEDRYNDTTVTELFSRYAIIRTPYEYVEELSDLDEIIYVEPSEEFYFNLEAGRAAACVDQFQGETGLTGNGVLVAIIDSGIDYTHADFRNEDGNTRIRFLWDQSADIGSFLYGRVPAGYGRGIEYASEDIDAILNDSEISFQNVIYSVSDARIKHGTAVAGVAAGNGRASVSRRYRGVATESELIVVKLAGQADFAFSTDIMEALDYCIRKAIELNMPIAVNMSLGNNNGAHDGSSLFEQYISDVARIWKTSVVIAVGNEGESRHHARVDLSGEQPQCVEIAIGERESSLILRVWKSFQDDFSMYIDAPDGNRIFFGEDGGAAKEFVLSGSRINVLWGQPVPYTAAQEIFIRWQSDTAIKSGIWCVGFVSENIRYGIVNMWLPTVAVAGMSTGFLKPYAYTTLTIPSTANGVIAVGAYNSANGTVASFSGRGNTSDGRTRPSVLAPGVDIMCPAPGNRYLSNTGTSIAAPFVTGSAALLMEWGIVKGNDAELYGQRLKAFVEKSTLPVQGIDSYPDRRAGWGIFCLAEILQ